jgi:hypothetical protein
MVKAKYEKGNVIYNNKPYKGESEYMITDIDQETEDYICAPLKGKHFTDKWTDTFRMKISFLEAHNYMHKV